MKDSDDVGKLGSLSLKKADLSQALKLFDAIENKRGHGPEGSIISQRVNVPMNKVESALSFWKPLYFGTTTEGRLLSGIEAYELGDDKLRVHPDKVPFIAMTNLMVLEAIKMMNAQWPTVECVDEMMFGTDREKEIADFWKKTFAPLEWQAQWAWEGVMAVLAGEPYATSEFLDNYKEQLP